MEFCDKIKKIRTDNNLTQEQFAEKLYVSRTAVSKWESGKGYPSIDSLKYMSKLFNISIDDLLSSEEILDIAEQDKQQKIKKNNGFIFGAFDLLSLFMIILPLYAFTVNIYIYSVSLFATLPIQKLEPPKAIPHESNSEEAAVIQGFQPVAGDVCYLAVTYATSLLIVCRAFLLYYCIAFQLEFVLLLVINTIDVLFK